MNPFYKFQTYRKPQTKMAIIDYIIKFAPIFGFCEANRISSHSKLK